MHPIVPNGLPNYLKGLQGELRSGTPGHLTELDTLGFMVRYLLLFMAADGSRC